MSDTEIQVPRNREAEEAVIGTIMQSRQAFEDARRMTQAQDFWFPAHETIWRIVEAMVDADAEVNPGTVLAELMKAKEINRVGGAAHLHSLIASPWTSMNVTHEARLVAESAQARKVLQVQQRMSQALTDNAGNHDDLMSAAARISLELDVLVEERVGERPIEGLESWDRFLARHQGGIQWMIPNLLMKQDVWMILAGEGGGKSMLTRQICFALGAGIHPWYPDRQVAPRRTLHIDLENAGAIVAEESAPIRTTVQGIGGYTESYAQIWHKPSGLDIRDRKDAILLERAIAETEAEVVTIGSLYKLFNRRGDSWDQAAEEARVVLDRIRERYNIALIIEAHQPKGTGGSDRPNTPFGSQQWIGWSAVGRTIVRVGDNMWKLDQFRGDRGRREMPVGMYRGGTLPWSPVWDPMEVMQGTWDELLTREQRQELGR